MTLLGRYPATLQTGISIKCPTHENECSTAVDSRVSHFQPRFGGCSEIGFIAHPQKSIGGD
jgi:hypothetical protein